MFEPTDFKLSLEKELKMRVIIDEIEHCEDINALQEQLKQCAKSLMTYQHMLGEVIKRQITSDLENWAPEISKIVSEITGAPDGSSSTG